MAKREQKIPLPTNWDFHGERFRKATGVSPDDMWCDGDGVLHILRAQGESDVSLDSTKHGAVTSTPDPDCVACVKALKDQTATTPTQREAFLREVAKRMGMIEQ